MMDRRPGICMRTGGAARGRGPHTVGERSRGRGCRIVNTLAGPSPPIKGHRSPCGRSRWLGRETFRDGAGPPDRVAWWWSGAAGRRVGRWPSRVQRGVAVRIARVAEPGSPWRSLPPNPGRCHGRAGSRLIKGHVARRRRVALATGPVLRRWASASVGNARFLRQLRRPVSVGNGAVFGTVWDGAASHCRPTDVRLVWPTYRSPACAAS